LNLLTEIRLPNYSGGMISDFQQLYEKISQLAELAQSLRSENAALRLNAAALAAENAALSKRMQEAHLRVTALLDKIPVAEQDEETE
jgi:cell division protein ZapB